MNVLTAKQVAQKTTLAEGTIRNWVCQNRFPKPFKLGSRAVWDEQDVDRWLLTRKQERSNEAV